MCKFPIRTQNGNLFTHKMDDMSITTVPHIYARTRTFHKELICCLNRKYSGRQSMACCILSTHMRAEICRFFFLLALSARECEWYKCSSGMCNAHSYIEYELTPELNVCLSINLFAVVVKCWWVSYCQQRNCYQATWQIILICLHSGKKECNWFCTASHWLWQKRMLKWHSGIVFRRKNSFFLYRVLNWVPQQFAGGQW